MKLTRYTDYALRVLIYLSLHPERQCSIAEIASSYGASQNHLMKVVQHLARGGFVASTRGRGGGLRLARTPEDIRVGEVVRLTEPDFDLADCAECRIASACGLTPALGRATAAFLTVLDNCTLAEIVRSGDSLRAILSLGLKPRPRPPRKARPRTNRSMA